MLETPPTLRLPRPDEVPNNDQEEVFERLKQRETANIVEGYKFRYNTEQDLPFKFFAEININNSRLWGLFVELAHQLPDEVCCIYGEYDEEPNYSSYADRAHVLNVLSNYQVELAQDCFIEFGLIYHTEEKLEEIFVKEAKHLQVWGTNEAGFRQLMARFQLDEIPDLNFVDEFPKVVEALEEFVPDARPPYQVIEELENMLP
ncbi:hypothetical protein [Polluticoccus soli]|uniref:hypothetical protein n=1 Tax=Polluticoccus soli TaxID=3034150 RepID=UPI0023E0B10A|nr:hypothetical protein [Flavipsychrobacter sp. JY13-12]